MKKGTFGMIAAIILLSSCKKDAVCKADGKVTISGKWAIISDASFSNVSMNNHPVNYNGQTGDYFDFRADSNLYIKEGGTFDTLHYSVTSDTTLVIDGFGILLNGVPETSFITHLSTHTLSITAPIVVTPGGAFGRKVALNR